MYKRQAEGRSNGTHKISEAKTINSELFVLKCGGIMSGHRKHGIIFVCVVRHVGTGRRKCCDLVRLTSRTPVGVRHGRKLMKTVTNELLQSVETVSYTHLDVYKRQSP